MSHIRVVFTGQGPSGLAEDRAVNVFHFEGLSTYGDDAPDAIARVANFYRTLTGGATRMVGEYLSPWVDRDATVTSYDMDVPPDRIPTVEPIVLPAAIGGSGLPNEVAICLSFEGAPPHTPRRRGRVYIGPLCLNADMHVAATIGDDARPTAQLMSDLGVAAAAMATPGGSVQWVIRSIKPTVNYVPVVSGWVDNAWDTQRRRGQSATTRDTWVALP